MLNKNACTPACVSPSAPSGIPCCSSAPACTFHSAGCRTCHIVRTYQFSSDSFVRWISSCLHRAIHLVLRALHQNFLTYAIPSLLDYVLYPQWVGCSEIDVFVLASKVPVRFHFCTVLDKIPYILDGSHQKTCRDVMLCVSYALRVQMISFGFFLV